MKHRTTLVVAAPLIAVATLMVGLRVGAGSGFRAALVYGAHASRIDLARGVRHHAFQMITYYEDRGVREAVAIEDLTVEMRSLDGTEIHWQGASNEDGVAEVTFELPAIAERIAFDARVRGEREPLAFGAIHLTQAPKRPEDRRTIEQTKSDARVRPSKREGDLLMDVYLESGRLVVGSPSEVWVDVRARKAEDSALIATMAPTVRATPEIGLAVGRTGESDAAPFDCSGYAKLEATALGQAASTQLEATGTHGEKGIWFGTLPTAPGAFWIQMPHAYLDGMKLGATVVAPNPRRVAYVEVDDAEGRVWSAALPLVVEPGDPLPRAHVPLEHLADGVYWLVASGDPRGAEKMSGATIGKTFLVDRTRKSVTATEACTQAVAGAQLLAPGTPRWLALDGIATRGEKNRSRHRTGLFIGLLALGAAALLETLLLTHASREARLALAAAATEDVVEKTTVKVPGGNLLVALLVALLGFAFLAALIIAKA